MMAAMSVDMFIDPAEDPRTDPPGQGSELATLTGFLDWYRKTLELKCSGLDAEAPGLELAGKREDTWRGKLSLRWVLTHMVEEYARHIGHADLLRERIDGAVGQ
jgi:hypothetical protein